MTHLPTGSVGSPPSGAYRLTLLGSWRVTRNGVVHHLPGSAQRLVALIALSEHASRNYVAGTLWPDVPEARAHGSLRSTIWRVTRACPGLLDIAREGLALDPSVVVDVRELRRMFDEMLWGDPSIQHIASWPDSLWGELLPGWYDEWVLLERERLRQMRVHALEVMTRSLGERGQYGEALEVGMATLAVAPLRESAHREIIRIHLAEGNYAEALRQFEVCAQLLRADLGLEPSEQMIDLMQPVIDGSLERRAGVDAVTDA